MQENKKVFAVSFTATEKGVVEVEAESRAEAEQLFRERISGGFAEYYNVEYTLNDVEENS